MTDEELLDNFRIGKPCSEKSINGDQLARVIRNSAKLRLLAPMTVCQTAVHGRVRVELDAASNLNVTFRQCEFNGPLTVRSPPAEKAKWALRFDRVRFTDLVYLSWMPLTAEPCFRQCRFDRDALVSAVGLRTQSASSLSTRPPGTEEEAAKLWDRPLLARNLGFVECRFLGALSVRLVGHTQEISFAKSILGPRSSTSVDLESGRLEKLTLSNSLVQGRLDVICAPATSPAGTGSGSWVLSLHGARLDGIIDLLKAGPPPVLDLHRAVLNSGGILLPEGFRAQFVAERHRDHVFLGNLRDICGCREGSELSSLQSRYADLATQADLLRGACRRVPGMSEHEDRSHFQLGIYRLLAEVAGLRRQSLTALLFVVASLAILFGSVIACPRDEVCAFSALLLPFAYVAAAGRPRSRWSRSLFIVWNFVVMYGMLGYGVRVLRVLLTAGLLIVLFAAIYGLTSAFFPAHGVVLRNDPETSQSANFITGQRYFEGTNAASDAATTTPPAKPLPTNPQRWRSVVPLQRALYFSTVTFTTLGYGDYRPVGRLQIVAAVEASLGALMIALIIVVFARRFLRL